MAVGRQTSAGLSIGKTTTFERPRMLHHANRKVAKKLGCPLSREFLFGLGLDEHKFLDYGAQYQARFSPRRG
jgi:hypothetical protein